MEIKMTVSFNTDNRAFVDDCWYECQSIASQLSKMLDVSTVSDFKPERHGIRDTNGNMIGFIMIETTSN